MRARLPIASIQKAVEHPTYSFSLSQLYALQIEDAQRPTIREKAVRTIQRYESSLPTKIPLLTRTGEQEESASISSYILAEKAGSDANRFGADSGGRTRIVLPPRDFKSLASTSFAMSAAGARGSGAVARRQYPTAAPACSTPLPASRHNQSCRSPAPVSAPARG